MIFQQIIKIFENNSSMEVMKNIITSGKAKEKILRYKPAQKVIIMHPSGEGNILLEWI